MYLVVANLKLMYSFADMILYHYPLLVTNIHDLVQFCAIGLLFLLVFHVMYIVCRPGEKVARPSYSVMICFICCKIRSLCWIQESGHRENLWQRVSSVVDLSYGPSWAGTRYVMGLWKLITVHF